MADEIDPRLREFATAPGPEPDVDAIVRAGRRRRRMRQLVPIATAAVLLLILAGIALLILQDRSAMREPIGPIPLPTPSASASTMAFAIDDAQANGQPTFGIGEVDDGVRVDGATFETAPCPDGVECPIAITLQVTNTRTTPFGGGIIVTVYRNGQELTGTGTGAQVQPGATDAVRVVLDPSTPTVPAANDGPGVYTWNWKLEQQGS